MANLGVLQLFDRDHAPQSKPFADAVVFDPAAFAPQELAQLGNGLAMGDIVEAKGHSVVYSSMHTALLTIISGHGAWARLRCSAFSSGAGVCRLWATGPLTAHCGTQQHSLSVGMVRHTTVHNCAIILLCQVCLATRADNLLCRSTRRYAAVWLLTHHN